MKTKYPELYKIAQTVADNACVEINTQIMNVESEMPYKAQWVLEETIKILQERV